MQRLLYGDRSCARGERDQSTRRKVGCGSSQETHSNKAQHPALKASGPRSLKRHQASQGADHEPRRWRPVLSLSFSARFAIHLGALQGRYAVCASVYLQLVLHSPYAGNPTDTSEQRVQLVLQHLATQGHSALEGGDDYRSRVRDQAAEGGSDPIVEHLIVRLLAAELPANLGSEAEDSVPGIARRSRNTVPQLMSKMNALVPQERSAAGPPIRIQQVHRSRAHDDAGQKLALSLHG